MSEAQKGGAFLLLFEYFFFLIFIFFSSTGVDQALGCPPVCSQEGYLSALQDHHNLLELATVRK